jgi:cold shock CspA family protein/tetratricopeptide (TPR) repeat protein
MSDAVIEPNVGIPYPLEEAIKSKRAILFIGAGASKESRDVDGNTPPNADQLRDILAERFFGMAIPNRDVMAVAEMAIAASGGANFVFEEVRKAFEKFEPSNAHKLIPKFNWRSIATTNYDCLIENAYSASPDKLQSIVRFVKDDEPIEEKMQAVINPVQYLKLHGCLDHIFDSDIPLVLSREQYSSYLKNRTRLFDRLKYLAPESVIIFVGYRLDDGHIRDLIYSLAPNKRPRWYMVNPEAESYDIDFWASKNVEVVKCRFGEFMRALDAKIPKLSRSIQISDSVADFPIRRFYTTNESETKALRLSFSSDLTFIHAGMPFEKQDAAKFYEGYDTGWGGIISRLDVRRKVEDDVIFTTLLENDNPAGPMLFVLRGAAGAGKTIALKRTAFEAATASSAMVIWLEQGGALRLQTFIELFELTARPIYLFVDQLGLQVEKVAPLLEMARTKKIPLVVIGAERDADWFSYCSILENEFKPRTFRVHNLSNSEVEGLLDLLERYNCLGLLKPKSIEERIAAFMSKADRQLLVALHELTKGRPFEEIVFGEHQRVYPEQARQLYLDIATMHQFGVHIRAGSISRISGITYDDYQREFFSRLDDIVRVETDSYSGDYCYKTRHSRVANLVFRTVCSDDASKSHQLRRIIEGFDVGYGSDLRALEEITMGRTLVEQFSNVDVVRSIYETAIKVAPRQAFIYQQWAVFELNHPHGSTLEAERLAGTAHEMDERSPAIIHTQAEIDRKRANEESSPVLKQSLRRRVRERLNTLPANSRFTVSSRCKLLVDEVADLSASLPIDAKPHEAQFFAEKVRDAERALARAQQDFDDDADIIQVEARLRQVLDQEDRALRALQRAWAAGPKGSGIASRIARIHHSRSQGVEALKVLKDALTRDPEDKSIHLAIAMHYLKDREYDAELVENHLGSSFSMGDNNFESRFVLAQFLFLRGKMPEALKLFELINSRAPESFRRFGMREDNSITERLPRFSGAVESMRERFIFLKSGSYPEDIFVHHTDIVPSVMDQLENGSDVNFRVRFNRAGPVAVDVQLGRQAH